MRMQCRTTLCFNVSESEFEASLRHRQMGVPELPADVWCHILSWGGPISLSSSLRVSEEHVSAMRIQRRIRDVIVLPSSLRAGDRLWVSVRRSWMEGVVVEMWGSTNVIIQVLRREKSRQYFFLPHPSLRMRRVV